MVHEESSGKNSISLILDKNKCEEDKIVIETSEPLKFSLQDIYLTIYAIKNESLARAEEQKKKIFNLTGGRKQIDDINNFYKDKFGNEGLFTSEHGIIQPTELGQIFVKEMNDIIYQYCNAYHRVRVNSGTHIKIGATQFMMDYVCKAYSQWEKANDNSKIELKLLRSAELETSLLDRTVDLSFGATVKENDDNFSLHKDLDFFPIKFENIGLITNKKKVKINTEDDLREIISDSHLIIPHSGIIKKFTDEMLKRYPELEKGVINWCNDIFFGISLLQNDIVHNGIMFILEGAANWTSSIWKRKENMLMLNYIDIPIELLSPKIYVGLFRRKDTATLKNNHPLQKCWKIFTESFNK